MRFATICGCGTTNVELLAIVVFIYTASGGLFAVAYTDAIQVGIAFIGSLGLLVFMAFNFGLEIPEEIRLQ